MPDRDKWASKQVGNLVARGTNPLDAAAAVKRFLAKLPYGADPDSYVAPAASLEENLASPAVTADLRAAWFGDENVPARFKRILDSGSE